MQSDVRLNHLHTTLYKILKTYTTTTFNLQLYSENAKICAYNGIKYTIESILKNFQNMHLSEYLVTTKYTFFKIKTCNNTITIIVNMHETENKIIFAISNKAI